MDDKSVKIYIALKHAGNAAKKVKEVPFILHNTPHTLRDLIEESVESCIEAYMQRPADAKDPAPLTDEEFDGMREIGKFAFGFCCNGKKTDKIKAAETAVNAVKDGLVRVFKGNDEITGLSSEIKIAEGDVFTFIRLVMLSGRMW